MRLSLSLCVGVLSCSATIGRTLGLKWRQLMGYARRISTKGSERGFQASGAAGTCTRLRFNLALATATAGAMLALSGCGDEAPPTTAGGIAGATGGMSTGTAGLGGFAAGSGGTNAGSGTTTAGSSDTSAGTGTTSAGSGGTEPG